MLRQPCWYFVTGADQPTWSGGWGREGTKSGGPGSYNPSLFPVLRERKKKKNGFHQPPYQSTEELWLSLKLRCPWIKYNQILVQTGSGEREASSFIHPPDSWFSRSYPWEEPCRELYYLLKTKQRTSLAASQIFPALRYILWSICYLGNWIRNYS